MIIVFKVRIKLRFQIHEELNLMGHVRSMMGILIIDWSHDFQNVENYCKQHKHIIDVYEYLLWLECCAIKSIYKQQYYLK